MTKTLKPVGVNSLCDKCVRNCKQADGTLLVDCPRFLKRPFKVAVHRYDQLDLFPADKK